MVAGNTPAAAKLFEGGQPFGAKLSVTQDDRGLNIGRVTN